MGLPKAEIGRDKALALWEGERSDYAREQMVLANIGLVGFVLGSLHLDVSDEDLYADGLTGLVMAVDKFDFGKGTKFSTFAVKAITNTVLNTLKKKRVGVAFSLDGTMDMMGTPYRDMLPSGFCLEDTVIDKLTVEDAWTHLTARERQAVRMVHFEGRTQTEAAKALGVSQSYLSRIVKGAMKKCVDAGI